VGPAAALDVSSVAASEPRWLRHVELPMSCLAQWQAHGRVHPCEVVVSAAGVEVALEHPAPGPAPGQLVVLYDGDRVIGSAVAA